ncbi:hypothetical protein LXL04_005067 [Taraxacum kok-saghyz]
MDWNGANPKPFAPRPAGQSSFAFLYNYNNDHYVYPPAGLGEMKHLMEMNQNEYENINQEKKKRLTNEQLEALENTFQEEKKLDPDTKMKLSHELSLQPRQIAVWFQNRRARWKTKQLECLYDTLKQEFEAVSREKQKLQEEVRGRMRTVKPRMGNWVVDVAWQLQGLEPGSFGTKRAVDPLGAVLALRSILKEQVSKRQGGGSSTGYTHISGEETVESTSVATIRTTTNNNHHHHHPLKASQHQAAIAKTGAMTAVDSNYELNYNPATSTPIPSFSNWAVLPSYP